MKKKSYIAPTIELIVLDNQISLALESYPPSGPDELVKSLGNFQVNPFPNTLV